MSPPPLPFLMANLYLDVSSNLACKRDAGSQEQYYALMWYIIPARWFGAWNNMFSSVHLTYYSSDTNFLICLCIDRKQRTAKSSVRLITRTCYNSYISNRVIFWNSDLKENFCWIHHLLPAMPKILSSWSADALVVLKKERKLQMFTKFYPAGLYDKWMPGDFFYTTFQPQMIFQDHL